jgi:hypothetical protein
MPQLIKSLRDSSLFQTVALGLLGATTGFLLTSTILGVAAFVSMKLALAAGTMTGLLVSTRYLSDSHSSNAVILAAGAVVGFAAMLGVVAFAAYVGVAPTLAIGTLAGASAVICYQHR